MSKKFNKDDRVYVPVAKFKKGPETPSSFHTTKVINVKDRSILVDNGKGETELVASSFCHHNIGILVLSIGDMKTETTLLDPLAKSVLQFCRLLLMDDHVAAIKVRSLREISIWWQANHKAYSHVFLVGHGSDATISLANGGSASTEDFMNAFDGTDVTGKTFVSLCCKTGYRTFGGVASNHMPCERFIAPFHSVHGAIASQFAQTFLIHHLLEGKTPKVAFKHARSAVPGSTSFRLWRKGKLEAGPKS